MPVCFVVAVLAVLKLGGFGAFLDRIPSHHFDFSQVFSKEFLLFWCVAMMIKQFTSTNNLMDASRYLCVKDSAHEGGGACRRPFRPRTTGASNSTYARCPAGYSVRPSSARPCAATGGGCPVRTAPWRSTATAAVTY